LQQKCAGHFSRETIFENYQFFKFQTLILYFDPEREYKQYFTLKEYINNILTLKENINNILTLKENINNILTLKENIRIF